MSDTVVIPAGRNKDADFGKYQYISELGEGAMGKVCKCFDPDFQRMVAVKTVHKALLNDASADEFRERFRNEMRAVGKLTHPNIVSVFDAGEKQGCPYFVMEYVEGQELKHMLDAKIPFSVEQSLSIIKGVLSGLANIHKNGITHRDLKPANIFISSGDGTPKIADFGIAKLESSEMTQIGTIIGSPKYMSPEQCVGEPVDARSDLFAIGIILYELLTAKYCFDAATTSSITQKIINVDVIPPSKLESSVPRHLDKVIKKALAKRAEDRFQDAFEFLNALDVAAEKPKKSPSKMIFGLVGGTITVASLGLFLWFGFAPKLLLSDKYENLDVKVSNDAPVKHKLIDKTVIHPLSPEKSAKLAKLFKVAETYKRIGRLVSPAGSNAFDAYQIILSIDPVNKTALAGISEIEQTLLEKARLLIDSGDNEQAVLIAKAGQALFPDSIEFTAIYNLPRSLNVE